MVKEERKERDYHEVRVMVGFEGKSRVVTGMENTGASRLLFLCLDNSHMCVHRFIKLYTGFAYFLYVCSNPQ